MKRGKRGFKTFNSPHKKTPSIQIPDVLGVKTSCLLCEPALYNAKGSLVPQEKKTTNWIDK